MTRRMGAPCCGGFRGSPQTIFDPEHKQVVQGILEEVQDRRKQKKLLAAKERQNEDREQTNVSIILLFISPHMHTTFLYLILWTINKLVYLKR